MIFMLTWGKKVISIKEDGDDGIDDPLPREWSSETDTIDGPVASWQLPLSSGRPWRSPGVLEWLGGSKDRLGRREGPGTSGGRHGCGWRWAESRCRGRRNAVPAPPAPPPFQTSVSPPTKQRCSKHQEMRVFIFNVCFHLPGAPQVVQVVKNLPGNAGDRRDSRSIPGLGRSTGDGNTTHSSILAWRNPTGRGA